MKRLLILTVLATMLCTSSGCRMWNNWFHRGDACDHCVGMVGGDCGSSPVMSGIPGSTSYIPSGTTMSPNVLPGPSSGMEVLPRG